MCKIKAIENSKKEYVHYCIDNSGEKLRVALNNILNINELRVMYPDLNIHLLSDVKMIQKTVKHISVKPCKHECYKYLNDPYYSILIEN